MADTNRTKKKAGHADLIWGMVVSVLASGVVISAGELVAIVEMISIEGDIGFGESELGVEVFTRASSSVRHC